MTTVAKFLYGLVWEAGVCNDMIARRNRYSKEVQFIMWEAGKHNHKKDFWVAFDKSHWANFWATIDFKEKK